jgi:hypothetical protein
MATDSMYLQKFYRKLARSMILQAVEDIKRSPVKNPSNNLYLRDIQAFVNNKQWLENVCEMAAMDAKNVRQTLEQLLVDPRYNPSGIKPIPLDYDPTEEMRVSLHAPQQPWLFKTKNTYGPKPKPVIHVRKKVVVRVVVTQNELDFSPAV